MQFLDSKNQMNTLEKSFKFRYHRHRSIVVVHLVAPQTILITV